MPRVPAVCDSCGALFASGFFIGGEQATFDGCTAGPCPRCGQMGHVPDGLYRFAADVIELVAGPARSVAEMARLAALLGEAQKRKAPPDEVRASLERESPTLGSKLAKLLVPRNPVEFYALVTVLLMVLTLAVETLAKKGSANAEPAQVLDRCISEGARPGHRATSTTAQRSSRPGRNDPCTCGSGKKFKHCCGRKASP